MDAGNGSSAPNAGSSHPATPFTMGQSEQQLCQDWLNPDVSEAEAVAKLMEEAEELDFDELIPVEKFFDSYMSGLQEFTANEGLNVDQLASTTSRMGSMEPTTEAMTNSETVLWNYKNGGLLHPEAPANDRNPKPTSSASCLARGDSLAMEASLTEQYRLRQGNSDVTKTRPRHTTVRAKLLNRATQKRYRERKKAIVDSLEGQACALNQELQRLRTVREEKLQLEDKVILLQQQLKDLDADIKRANADEGMEAPAEEDPLQRRDTNGKVESVAQCYVQHVDDLKTYMNSRNLTDPDKVDLSTVTELEEAEIGVFNTKVLEVCVAAVSQLYSVNVWALIAARVQEAGSNMGSDTQQFWIKVAQSIKLTAEQQKTVLTMRRLYLLGLNKLYDERRELNSEAIALMTQRQRAFGSTVMDEDAVNLVQLRSVMERIEANLCSEQRGAAQLDWFVFDRVCSPLQCAWLILSSYPNHCDTLSLMNAVAELNVGSHPAP